MWEGKRNTSKSNPGIPIIEALESRQLMSVAVHPITAAVVVKPVAARVVTAKPATKPAVQAFPSYVPSIGAVKGTNVVGNWTGSIRLDGTTTDQPLSVTFNFQRGVAASGTFNLGPAVGNRAALSTMVFDLHNNVRALIAGPKLSVGFTGALTSNGKVLYGRVSFNVGTGWQTGMFTLNRA